MTGRIPSTLFVAAFVAGCQSGSAARPPRTALPSRSAAELESLPDPEPASEVESLPEPEPASPPGEVRDSRPPIDAWAARAHATERPFDRQAVEHVFQQGQICTDEQEQRRTDTFMFLPSTHVSVHGTVVVVTCDVGAYQEAQAIYLVREGQAHHLPLPYPGDDGQLVERPNGGWLQIGANGTSIRDYVRYRGAGDCGYVAEYDLRNDRLVLRELRERPCPEDIVPEGAPMPPWPRVYPPPARP